MSVTRYSCGCSCDENDPKGDYVLYEDYKKLEIRDWYLLYGGASCDGRGKGPYVGRTTSIEEAKKHLAEIRKNPYSTGRVVVINATDEGLFGR